MMESPENSQVKPGPWTSLWVTASLSLLAQLGLCQFFSLGEMVPISIDVNPSNLWKYAYQFPPTGSFQVLNWLGTALLPPPLNPFSAAANLPAWLFFTTYAPVMGTCALVAMAFFLLELELPRPAAVFGGVVYAWQGDLLPFVYPGHYAYIATWTFFALAAWGALRAVRLRHWAYALISGASCGLMFGLQPDRGAIASLLIAALYLATAWNPGPDRAASLRYLALCVGSALVIALAPFLALFQGEVIGVKMGGESDRARTYDLVTQYSLGPDETLTYLVPGLFGWFVGSHDADYWGWIGESPDWPRTHEGMKNSNLAISTTGTVATVLALIGALLLLPEPVGGLLGPAELSPRQKLYTRLLLALGVITLVLAWGWHTPFYRPLFALPLMDKWRNPLKWLEMTNFALAVLSALGVRQVIRSLDGKARPIRQGLFWFTMAMLSLLVLLLLASYPFTLGLRPLLLEEGYDPAETVGIVAMIHTSLFFAVVLMTLLCVLICVFWRPENLRRGSIPNPFLERIRQASLQPQHLPLTLAALLMTLVVAQMAWVASKFVQPIPLAAMTASVPLIEALRSEGDQVRVSVATQDQILNILLQNQFAADRISCLEVSAASRVPEDLKEFFEAFATNRARLWFLTGVKNVVIPQEFMPQLQNDSKLRPNIAHADGYVLETPASPNLPTHAMVALRDYMAKATFVPDADFYTSQDEILARLIDPKWNPRNTVLLNSLDNAVTAVTPTMSQDTTPMPSKTDLKVYTPNEIVVELLAPVPGYLLINDAYDPDWQAQVNGQPAELLKADGILRAVRVPAGYSSVTMHYAARYHYGVILRQLTGLNIGDRTVPAEWANDFCDGAMLAAWIVACLALWRRHDDDAKPPGDDSNPAPAN